MVKFRQVSTENDIPFVKQIQMRYSFIKIYWKLIDFVVESDVTRDYFWKACSKQTL